MRLLLITLLLIPLGAAAEIYKSVDAEGNTIYTDKPDSQAEEFIVPSMNAIPMPKPAPKQEPEEKPATPTYQSFSIVSPKTDQVIRDNNGNIALQLRSQPKLQAGHYFAVYVDGHMLVKKSNQTSISIPGINRGEHQITAVIRDAGGKTLARSQSITIHMKRQSVGKANNKVGPFAANGKRIQPGPQGVYYKPGPQPPPPPQNP
jgi:hypothetical protein